MRTVAIVLAAGNGTRFGGGKMLARLQGKPILQHVLDHLAEAGVTEVVVVLGGEAADIEETLEWRAEKRIRNPDPDRGLSSSLQAGMAALESEVDAALIVLGDQPLTAPHTIQALLAERVDPDRPIVLPAYRTDRGRNPVLVRRAAFDLIAAVSGDRGLGPVIAAHPELVAEVSVDADNPDVDTPEDLARVVEAAWAARVKANREQVERIREVPDGADFYAPVRSLFRADPTRSDDPVLNALLDLVRPGETWLDVGAGAGRFALPIARALDPSGGSVVAIDTSESMVEALREIADDYYIENVRTLMARWPIADPMSVAGDVTLIAHVGYDIEAIGRFVDALEVATRRLCVAVLMEGAPAAAADPFWPPTHGEARVLLPALPDFVELLRARGRQPSVTMIEVEPRRFDTRETLGGFVSRQLWIDPAGAKWARFQAALEALTEQSHDGWAIRDRPMNQIGIVTWNPPVDM